MHVPPNGGPPPHRHDFEEMFTVLEGEVRRRSAGRRWSCAPGRPSTCPRTRRTRSPTPAPHRRGCCACARPSGQEEFFTLVGQPVTTRTEPPAPLSPAEETAFREKAQALAPRFATELLPPPGVAAGRTRHDRRSAPHARRDAAAGPLDLGGDLAEQRRLLVEMLTAIPLPDDVRTGRATSPAFPSSPSTSPGPVASRRPRGGALSARRGLRAWARRRRRWGWPRTWRAGRGPGRSPSTTGSHRSTRTRGARRRRRRLRRTAGDDRSRRRWRSSASPPGGGLVLATLVALRDRGLPLPSSAAVFSPWADLTLSGATITTKADVDVAVTAAGCGPAAPSTSARPTPRHRRSAPCSPTSPACRRC